MSYRRRYKIKDDRFGLLVQRLREKAGLSQNEVANALDLSERTIQHWEAGTTYPSVEHLKKLVEVYIQQAAFTVGHERDEVKAFWDLAMQSTSHRKEVFEEVWSDALLSNGGYWQDDAFDQSCPPGHFALCLRPLAFAAQCSPV